MLGSCYWGKCQTKKQLSALTEFHNKIKFIPKILILIFVGVTLIHCLKFPIPEKKTLPPKEIRHLEFHSSDFGDEELNDLPPMPKLEFLSLGGTRVQSLKSLTGEKYPRLATLYLEDTKVDDKSLEDWINPPAYITKLFLNRTKIENLDWSEKFPKLRRLNIEQTKVSSLKPLRKNKDLIHLWMGRTNVKDLKPIQKLKNLEYISIDNLWISKENIREFKEKRPYTKVVQYTDIHF